MLGRGRGSIGDIGSVIGSVLPRMEAVLPGLYGGYEPRPAVDDDNGACTL